jgi:hypothetical protein
MTTAEAAALMAAGALLTLTVVLTVVVVWTASRLRREVGALRTERLETAAVLAELRAATAQARAAATYLDDRTRHPGAASKLAYEALSTPVVKGLALASGMGQAARSLRTKS